MIWDWGADGAAFACQAALNLSGAANVWALEQEAEALHARDRAWFYQRFHLDEVVGGNA